MDKPLVTIDYKTADGIRICVEVSTPAKNCLNSLTGQSVPKGGKTGGILIKRIS